MAKIIVQTFEVRGTFPFPIDMLRYDCCYPAREAEDSYNINATIQRVTNGPVVVRLRRRVENKNDMPTFGRWSSFNWTVLTDSIKFEIY